MLQWLSVSNTARPIDRAMGQGIPNLGGQALLTYQRYNAMFTQAWFKQALGRDVDAAYLETMQEMDKPENLGELAKLGQAVAELQVKAEHLPANFDRGVQLA